MALPAADRAVTPVIVGAGVAGLATAVALGQRGVPCRIIERRAVDGPVGFGFLLMPNGARALDALGLGAALRDHTPRMRRLTVYAADDPAERPLLDQALGADHFGVDRAFLLDRLREAALACGASIHWHAGLARLERAPRGQLTALHLTDGRRIEAPLLIGADGVSSRVRRGLFPAAERRPLHIWEMVTLAESVELAAILHGRLVKYLDRPAGRAIGMLPLDRQRVIVYLQMNHGRWVLPPPDADGRRRQARSIARPFPALARRVIAACDFADSHVYATGDLDPLPAIHAGPAVLVGDAAHGFSPFASQGAATALEDAVALAELLAPALRAGPADPAAVGDAFERFHRQREATWTRHLIRGRALAQHFLTGRGPSDQPPNPGGFAPEQLAPDSLPPNPLPTSDDDPLPTPFSI